MWAFLWTNRSAMLAIVACALLFGGGFALGDKYENNKWSAAEAKRVEATQSNLITAQNGVIAKERAGTAITNKIGGDYEKSNAAIDSSYDAILNGLRGTGASTASNGLPGVSAPAAVNNGAACTNGLSEQNKESLIALARDAQRNTAKLIACQQWIEEQQGD